MWLKLHDFIKIVDYFQDLAKFIQRSTLCDWLVILLIMIFVCNSVLCQILYVYMTSIFMYVFSVTYHDG